MAKSRQGLFFRFAAVAVISGVLCALIASLVVNIFERKQEAREPFLRLVQVNETMTDPRPWGVNWPHHFDEYKRTAGDQYYGGSSAMPESKLKQDPWLRRLYAGYAFSIDYREARGHAYMLYDQTVTERVTERQQSGACLHCHASVIPTYRRIGLEAMGKPADKSALTESFKWPAVMKGFEKLSTQPYEEVFAELLKTPDGTPRNGDETFATGLPETLDVDDVEEVPGAGGSQQYDGHEKRSTGEAHPVSCVDCHDPETMSVRVTRPGFIQGITDLAESSAATPHLPSIEEWRRGSRDRSYDPNVDASRQEMRSFVCGQCHVEYYCASRMTLTFPWGRGAES